MYGKIDNNKSCVYIGCECQPSIQLILIQAIIVCDIFRWHSIEIINSKLNFVPYHRQHKNHIVIIIFSFMLRMNIKSRKPGRANMTHKEVDNR